LKVLFLIDSLHSGGAQTQLSILSNYLHTNKQCEVEIITYVPGNHHAEITEGAGIKVTYFEKKSKFDIGLLFRLVKYISENNFQIVCAFLFTPSFYALMAKLLMGKKIKVLVSERTFEGYLNTIAKLTRKLYPLADFITANSETQTNILRAKFPSLIKRIHFVKNGVDTNRFKQGSINYTPLRVACIGRIEKLKNPICMIEAMHILKNNHQIEIQVKWAGNVHQGQEGQQFLKECNDLLLHYQLLQNWEWMGVVKQIPELLQQSEMLVHPSFGEGFPNTICEGLASGKVVFASSVYDHPLIIKEGYNGYLFNPNKPDELANKILEYLSLSETEKKNIQSRARTFAENEFSYSKMGDSFYQLIS